MMTIINRYVSLRNKKRVAVGIAAIIVLLVVITITSFQYGETLTEEAEQKVRTVNLINVLESSTEQSTLSTIGVVRSEREAELLTERSGEVTGVYATVGSFVSAGTIIAEIQNGAERAAVLQAEGLLDQSEATLQKVLQGLRSEQLSILETQALQAEQNLDGALSAGKNTLLSAYASTDDAIARNADQLFINPDTDLPQIILTTTDAILETTAESDRLFIQDMLDRQQNVKNLLSNDDVLLELEVTKSELEFIKDFLDTLNQALNKSIATETVSASEISAFKTTIGATRTSILSNLSAVTTAQDNIQNKQSLFVTAETSLEQGVTGERDEDILSAEAAVKQARGSFAAARANLEKTLIRTPISGRINTLSLQRGDFVSAFEPAAVVSNDSGFIIESFITSDDIERVIAGSSVLIDDTVEGVVATVAPGIDPQTKKIKVTIGVIGVTELVRGSSVSVQIQKEEVVQSDEILVPISSLKVEPNRILVFTVDEGSQLVAHEIREGSIIGNKIVILEGVTTVMNIVEDARGLREGQRVTIK